MNAPLDIKQKKELHKRLLNFKNLKFELKDEMRYDDVGDYYDNTIISYDMKDDIINNAIMIHEFIEYTLIKSAGLTAELIDRFDTEVGSEDLYPEEYKLYRKFHRMASKIERQFVENLGLNWNDHEHIINTVKVQVAVKQVTDELHKAHPSQTKLEESKKIVQDEME